MTHRCSPYEQNDFFYKHVCNIWTRIKGLFCCFLPSAVLFRINSSTYSTRPICVEPKINVASCTACYFFIYILILKPAFRKKKYLFTFFQISVSVLWKFIVHSLLFSFIFIEPLPAARSNLSPDLWNIT